MRVAINGLFWAQQYTGSGQYLRNLLQHFLARFPDSFVLCAPHSVADQVDVRQANLECIPLASPFDRWHQNLAKLWYEQCAFPRICRMQHIDVAHVPYFAPPLRSHCPTVVTIHDLIPLLLPAYRGSLMVQAYTALVSKTAARAAMILTDSQASACDIVQHLGVDSARLRVIYLAAEARYRPLDRTQRRPTLSRLGLPSSYLLYLGGFDQRKNVLGLLRAYAQVAERLDLPLVVAGRLPSQDSAFAPDPRILAQALRLDERVIFTGWVDEEDKPALYAGARAFLFPSSYEGFGLPVLEALSCGTPAIVGAGSSLEEIGGPGALVVAHDDTEALADAMLRLGQDDALHTSLAQAGLAHASSFSWERTAQETHQAYEDVL